MPLVGRPVPWPLRWTRRCSTSAATGPAHPHVADSPVCRRDLRVWSLRCKHADSCARRTSSRPSARTCMRSERQRPQVSRPVGVRRLVAPRPMLRRRGRRHWGSASGDTQPGRPQALAIVSWVNSIGRQRRDDAAAAPIAWPRDGRGSRSRPSVRRARGASPICHVGVVAIRSYPESSSSRLPGTPEPLTPDCAAQR